MRVVVDAREIYRHGRRGIGKTLLDLYSALIVRQPEWEFVLVHEQDVVVPRFAQMPNVRSVKIRDRIPGGWRFDFWQHAIFSAVALHERAAIVHEPANTGSRFIFSPAVLTVHDLIPHDLNPESREARRWLAPVARSVEAARHVITPSEHTKQRLCETVGCDSSKVTVIPWAPESQIASGAGTSMDVAALARYGLAPGESYVLAYGAGDPRKNSDRIVRAYLRLPEQLRTDHRLLLVGFDGDTLSRFIDQFSGSAVIFHGFVPEDDMPGLMRGATMLCYASLSEGFGLPVLDAMACGVPVLASCTTSIPEVLGSAGMVVDPFSVESITAGLEKMLESAVLREDMAERGVRRSRDFSWELSAKLTAQVLARAAEQ